VPDVRLRVNGRDYAGWKSATVERSIEALAGGFHLEVSERWGPGEPWPIVKEDECAVLLEGEQVISGHVSKINLAISAEDRSVAIEGKDRAAGLVQCSALLDTWEFKNIPLLGFAKKLLDPYGISVSLAPGVSPAPLSKISVDPGDSAFEALERACRMSALLAVSDGNGGVTLMRPGPRATTTELVQGRNILSGSSSFDAEEQFRTYSVLGQHAGSDEHSGKRASVKASATDMSVRRGERTLLVRAEGNATTAQAKTRAEWEATTRFARADEATITVQGWTQDSGALWPVNALVRVRAPGLRMNGFLLITRTRFSLDESGFRTELSLKPPNAFLPEPVIPENPTPANYWKEIQNGV
jgi:prophage tail gpP-like protein